LAIRSIPQGAGLPALILAGLLASGEISEHNSMDFFGVKKRHPYPSAQRSYGVKAIMD
jgi:hypothetical protein